MAISRTGIERLVGWAGIAIGVLVALIGLDVVPTDEASIRAPRLVVVLGGVIFVAGGALVLTAGRTAWAHLFAFTFYLSFAATMWWVALAAPGDMFEGDSLLLSDEADVLLARVLFALVATLASVILIYALWKLLWRRA